MFIVSFKACVRPIKANKPGVVTQVGFIACTEKNN